MDTMDCITTVDGLIEALEDSDPNDYPSILKSMEIDTDEFDEFVTWEGDNYTRNSIYRSEEFELILLCWNPGDETPIHSHDGQKCWVYQVSSTIEEERYEKDSHGNPSLTHKQSLEEGALTYMDDRMGYHVLANRSERRASTLHLYMRPIDNCEYFCEEENTFKEKGLDYDSKAY